MRVYRCHFMNTAKMITAGKVIGCANDNEAQQSALRLAARAVAHAVDDWDEARKVFHPSKTDDAHSRLKETGVSHGPRSDGARPALSPSSGRELRAVADDMRNPASHEIFRRMANDYNLLADNTEARAKLTPRRQTPTG